MTIKNFFIYETLSHSEAMPYMPYLCCTCYHFSLRYGLMCTVFNFSLKGTPCIDHCPPAKNPEDAFHSYAFLSFTGLSTLLLQPVRM